MHFTDAWSLVKDRLKTPRQFDHEREKVQEAVATLDIVMFELNLVVDDMEKISRRLTREATR